MTENQSKRLRDLLARLKTCRQGEAHWQSQCDIVYEQLDRLSAEASKLEDEENARPITYVLDSLESGLDVRRRLLVYAKEELLTAEGLFSSDKKWKERFLAAWMVRDRLEREIKDIVMAISALRPAPYGGKIEEPPK